MNESPLVSIIVTGFNESAFIEQSIDSMLNQNYGNIELILSDNCSSDDTYEIMRHYAEKYQDRCRIVVTQTKENIHISGNLAHACTFAKGDIIVRQCGDDISLPNRVTETVAAFRENPEVHVLGTLFESIDQEGLPLDTEMTWLTVTKEINDACRWTQCEKILLRRWPGIFGCSLAFRRNVVDKFERIPSGLLYDDQIISFRGFLLGRIFWIQTCLVKYRQHASNAVNSFKQDRAAQEEVDERRRKQTALLPKVWERNVKFAEDTCLITREEAEKFHLILREAKLFLGIQGEWNDYSLLKKFGLLLSSAISRRRYPRSFMVKQIFTKRFQH